MNFPGAQAKDPPSRTHHAAHDDRARGIGRTAADQNLKRDGRCYHYHPELDEPRHLHFLLKLAPKGITSGMPTLPPHRHMFESMRDRSYFTYIMASRSRVLYIGITNSVTRRNTEHKERTSDSFTAKHRCTHLVWYETFHSPSAAIAREKQLKGWTRAKKIALIEQTNPGWRDLSEEWGKPIKPYTAPDPPKEPEGQPVSPQPPQPDKKPMSS